MASKSTDAFSRGLATSTKNPILFVPMLIPIIIQIIFLFLAYAVFPFTSTTAPNAFLIWGGYFIAAFLGFFASCMVVDMANDSINGNPINLKKSYDAIMGRLGTLIVAALISAVFFITFILIPIALFIITIAVVDKTDAIESTKKSFNFVVQNLGDVIIFVIIAIVLWLVLDIGFAFIPVVGAYLGAIIIWLLAVFLLASSLHFYLSLSTAPPPPPPPPES